MIQWNAVGSARPGRGAIPARPSGAPPQRFGPRQRLFREVRMTSDSTPDCCGGRARGERGPLWRGLLIKAAVPFGLFALLALLGVLLR